MKRLFLRLTLFTPIILIIVLTNYFIDPANLFFSRHVNNESISYEQTIVNYLREGYNVTNIDNYDERKFQELFIESLKNTPEIVILGSSRAQLIESSFFNNEYLINNSVTGATIEDLLSIYNIYEKNLINPKKIIIELSPWMLNKNNEQTRWKLFEDDYSEIIRKITLHDNLNLNKDFFEINPKYYELISFEYFQESIKSIINSKHSNKLNPFFFNKSDFSNQFSVDSLLSQFSKTGFTYLPSENEDKIAFLNRVLKQPGLYKKLNKIYPDYPLLEDVQNLLEETKNYQNEKFESLTETEKENIIKNNRKLIESIFPEYCPISIEPTLYKTIKSENTGLTRLKDGTITYPKNFRERTIEEVNNSAYTYANNNMFGIENFNNISEEKVHVLIDFIKYLKKKNVEIYFLLVPYHPFVYSIIKSKQSYYNVMAAEQAIKVIASENNIELWGSYNPNTLNLNDSAFYDGMHLKKSFLKKIIR